MPKTAAFCDLSVRHPRSRPTTASSSSPDLTEKRLVFGAGSFNGADFCRGKEVRAGNTGRIVKHTDAASGVNPPVKTIRGSTLLCYIEKSKMTEETWDQAWFRVTLYDHAGKEAHTRAYFLKEFF